MRLKNEIAIVTDDFPQDLTSLAKGAITGDRNGPASLEVIVSRFPKAGVVRIANILKALGFEPTIIRGTNTLADFVGNHQRNGKFPYVGAINASVGTPEPFQVGQAPVLLEMLRVPYSGPDPQSLLVMRDKSLSKIVAGSIGIDTPNGIHVSELTPELLRDIRSNLFPLIIKPNSGSASVGVSGRIQNFDHKFQSQLSKSLDRYPDGLMIEEFITGDEITVIHVGNGVDAHVIPLILRAKNGGVLPPDFVNSTANKTIRRVLPGGTAWFLARDYCKRLDCELLEQSTRKLAMTLRARDMVRFDFKISAADGRIKFIECNGQPSINHLPGSIFEALNNRWFKEEGKVEKEFIRAAMTRIKLL